ncbi:MAG: DNA polymerase III subunit delta [Candidatus Marinimicrobia bacterium]|nr:DNA polymerase III subunit delta [Candidatus Neomarinimicrobiota bacterium]
MKIKEALKEVSYGNIYPIYFLKGNDYFLQNFFIDKVAAKFFGDDPVNKIFMQPEDMKSKEIIERLIITDLFATKKLFIIRNPQRIIGKPGIDLLEICHNPNSNFLIFLIIDDWLAKSVFISKIESIIQPLNVQTPYDQDIVKWANYLLKLNNKNAESSTVKKLIEMTGDSLAHLNNEINKLCLLIGSRKNIELDDIEQISGWKRERKLWEFLLALGNKKLDSSIYIGKTLIEYYGSILSLIYPLTNFFQEILYIKMKNGTFNKSNSYIGLPRSIKNKITYFANGYSVKKIRLAIKLLHNIDKKIKTQTINDETELIQFIGRIIG